jgi:hypothetical protein
MENIEIDFYTKFEEDREIRFSIKTDNYTKIIRIWEGYFNEIMEEVELSDDGTWTSLAYYYHLLEGWYKEDNWQIPDIEKALLQLQNIKFSHDRHIQKNANTVLVEIVNLLLEAIERKTPIYISIGG